MGVISIRSLGNDGLTAVAALADGLAADRSTSEFDSDAGFLVSDYLEGDYRSLLDAGYRIIGARAGGSDRLAAFALYVFAGGLVDSLWVEQHLIPGSVYVKQVVVDPAYARRGFASLLYREVASATESDDLAASVLLRPINRASVRLHEHLGFGLSQTYLGEDGFFRGLYTTF